jgi:iron complex outermembrane receptor protein
MLLRWAPTFRSATMGSVTGLGYVNYPGDFGSQLNGNSWDRSGFFLSPDALRGYIASETKSTNSDFERRVAGEIDVREVQSAAYFMQNMEWNNWSGNAGVRVVKTQVLANIVVPIRAGLCPKIEPGKPVVACAAIPQAINTAGDGSTYFDGVAFNPLQGQVYYKAPTDKSFSDILPSLNVRWEIAPKLVGRFGASRTIGRQNYNVLGTGFGTPSCSGTAGCTVTGPNPDLKPLSAQNLDLSLAWYFAPRSLALVNLYKSRIAGYPKTGTNNQGTTVDLVDPSDNTVKSFYVLSSSQQGASIEGIEIGFEQPIGMGFGIQTNFSRARTRVEDGRPMVGASENSANVGGYFENDKFSARLVYNYRGKYVSSSTAPAPTANSQGNSVINGVVMPVALTWASPVSNVALSLNYDFTKQLRLSFDATNLTNPTRAQYRYSEEEQQKLDVSGRQYYLVMRYKF